MDVVVVLTVVEYKKKNKKNKEQGKKKTELGYSKYMETVFIVL